MTAYSLPVDEATTALLTFLRTTGRDVWDGVFGGDPATPTYPYHILYEIQGGSADPMPDLDLDLTTVTAVWQVTTVSRLRNQCGLASRQVRDLILGRTRDRPDQMYGNTAGWAHDLPAPPGWSCIDRRPDPAMPGTDRVGDPPTAVFTRPARYLLTYTPIA